LNTELSQCSAPTLLGVVGNVTHCFQVFVGNLTDFPSVKEL